MLDWIHQKFLKLIFLCEISITITIRENAKACSRKLGKCVVVFLKILYRITNYMWKCEGGLSQAL